MKKQKSEREQVLLAEAGLGKEPGAVHAQVRSLCPFHCLPDHLPAVPSE